MCISSGFFRWFNMVVGVARSQSVDIIIRKLRRKKTILRARDVYAFQVPHVVVLFTSLVVVEPVVMVGRRCRCRVCGGG